MTDKFRIHPCESPQLSSAGATDVGRKRKHNEDTIRCRQDLGLFLVADGMGGHCAGDVASKLAAQTIEMFFEETDGNWDATGVLPEYPDIEPGAARLVCAVRLANDEVVAASRDIPAHRGMGTTVVAAHVTADGMIHIAHVGDSRCYRVGVGDIEQVTQDHSFLNNVKWSHPEIDDGVMANIPRNVITRALGTKEAVEVEVRSEMTLPGDIYLLCSDGLSGMIHASDIQYVLGTIDEPKDACAELIARANKAGGKDNVSAVVVRFDEPDDTMPNEVMVAEPAPSDGPLRYDPTLSTWVCAKCGREHVDGTSFCVECGAALV